MEGQVFGHIMSVFVSGCFYFVSCIVSEDFRSEVSRAVFMVKASSLPWQQQPADGQRQPCRFGLLPGLILKVRLMMRNMKIRFVTLDGVHILRPHRDNVLAFVGGA